MARRTLLVTEQERQCSVIHATYRTPHPREQEPFPFSPVTALYVSIPRLTDQLVRGRSAGPLRLVSGRSQWSRADSAPARVAPPVTEVFMAQQYWIEGAPPLVLPPRHKMGQVMADDLEGCRCASLGVQGCKILIERRMHPIAPCVLLRAPFHSTITLQILRRVQMSGKGMSVNVITRWHSFLIII